MKRFKQIIYISLILLIIGTARISFSAAIQIIPFHAVDSPVEITQIQLITVTNEYQINIRSKASRNIVRVTLKGVIFDMKGVRIGGLLSSIDLDLKSAETKTLYLNFENIAYAKKETLSKSMSDLFQDGNVILLIPYRVNFKPLSDQPQDNEDAYYWTLDYHMINNLTPINISSFLKVQGKIIKDYEPIEPEDFCSVCNVCRQEVFSCGNALISESCRSYACTQSFACSCPTNTCSYICKPLSQCC